MEIEQRRFNMFQSKETFREIVIARGSGESDESSLSKESQISKQRTKSIHPPIESQWTLPPIKESKPSSSSSSAGIKSMLSYPLKIRDSLKKLGRSQSMQAVLEGTHDPKDEQFVETFRELLFLEGVLSGKDNDYHTLIRFLRMRDFDLSKAKDTYINYLKWRKSYGVDAISKQFKFDEYSEVKKFYPHGFHGVDRFGRPVYIERIGMVDLDALLQATSIERFVMYHVSEQEKTLKSRYPACSIAAKKHIASTTSILDVKGVGMSSFSKPARSLFVEIQKIDSNFYPETLNKLLIINAGSGFRMLWKAIRAFLDARTLAKIQVLGSNYQSSLTEIIDPSNLPSFLGGNCTCADYGGCLFSDKGPWNNPEIQEILQSVSVTEEIITDENGPEGSNEETANGLKPTEQKNGIRTPVEKIEAQKIQALQAVLLDSTNKIQELESVLEGTKMALKGLAEQIAALRRI